LRLEPSRAGVLGERRRMVKNAGSGAQHLAPGTAPTGVGRRLPAAEER
jgi:hypothetical protein